MSGTTNQLRSLRSLISNIWIPGRKGINIQRKYHDDKIVWRYCLCCSYVFVNRAKYSECAFFVGVNKCPKIHVGCHQL